MTAVRPHPRPHTRARARIARWSRPIMGAAALALSLSTLACGTDSDLKRASEGGDATGETAPSDQGGSPKDQAEATRNTAPPEDPVGTCAPFEPTQAHPELALPDGQPAAKVMLCDSAEALDTLIERRDKHGAPEGATPANFKDPLPQQTGMTIYDTALRQTGTLTWFVPILFNGTPPMSQAQVTIFDDNKRLANDYVEVWKTPGGGTYDPYAWTGGKRWEALAPVLKRTRRRKDFVRAFVLREGGVLFVEDPRAASDIFRFISITDLFDEEEIWHRRGDAIHKLRRKNKLTYVYAEGDRAGEKAKLLIFDRLATTREGVEARLGWDLNRLRPTLALKAFRVTEHKPDLLRGRAVLRSATHLRADTPAFHVPEFIDGGVARKRPGEQDAQAEAPAPPIEEEGPIDAEGTERGPSQLKEITGDALVDGELMGAALEIKGELTVAVVIPPAQRAATLKRINEDRAGAALKRGIVFAGEQMLAEELPFDEPKTEVGQQDGSLRPLFADAYRRGAWSYEFNGDRYRVFNKDGTPQVPQVCIDFVYDTVERWSGAWWAHKDHGERLHSPGAVDITGWVGARQRRQVSMLVKTAQAHPERFKTLYYPVNERIPYGKTADFYGRLRTLSATTLPGDIVAIHGLKRDGRNHWHSFLIYDLDPIYNTPYLVIGNTGRVRIQPWHAVMRTGLGRGIVARMRWREDWLSGLERPQHAARHPAKDAQPKDDAPGE